MQQGIGEIAYSDTFGGFAFWPDNLNWSFQFIRLVSTAPVGGADFTEVFHAVRSVKAGDEQAWYDSLHGLASALDDRAVEALKSGHRSSARELWLRASNYFRAAGFFYDIDDERCLEAMEGRIRCFRSAAALAEPIIEPVEVPYEGTSLPGYYVPPTTPAEGAAPAAIVFGGGDAIAEEMYFHIGRALASRGFAVLLVDGPGMGEALRRGIVARYDWEVPTAAAIDFLAARGDVDVARIAVIAESLGGYYAARAAAFEPRLGACVNWGGPYSFPLQLLTPMGPDGELPAGGRPARRLISLTGSQDAAEAREKLSKFTLDGIVERITCPVLLLAGGAEVGFLRRPGDKAIEFRNPAERVFEELRHDQKKLVVYPSGTSGSAHCQADSVVQAHHDICDWLESVFARQARRR